MARSESFGIFDEYSECLAIGRIGRSEKEGVFSNGGLPGINYNVATVPPNSDIWFEVYLKQRPEYLADKIPDSYQVYCSQTGGEFVLYSVLQRILPFDNPTKLEIFYCINAILCALCFTLLLGWIFRSFGLISAIVVLLLTVMSSWITLFSSCLWWSLWASYIPFVTMLLVLEYNHKVKKLGIKKILVYLFLAVFAKCLFNGYEFISTILVSAMCPIIFYGFLEKVEIKSFIRFFLKATCSAILAVLAQMIILVVQIRIVLGSFAAGVDYIVTSYVRRSLSATDDFSKLPFSVLFKKYLKGNVFRWDFLSDNVNGFYFGYVILIIGILAVVVYYLSRNLSEYYKRLNLSLLLVTGISIIAPVSWFIIFKQHSANHFHLDYIVWYMPFLLLGFLVIGEGISLLFNKLGIYKRNLISEPNL